MVDHHAEQFRAETRIANAWRWIVGNVREQRSLRLDWTAPQRWRQRERVVVAHEGDQGPRPSSIDLFRFAKLDTIRALLQKYVTMSVATARHCQLYDTVDRCRSIDVEQAIHARRQFEHDSVEGLFEPSRTEGQDPARLPDAIGKGLQTEHALLQACRIGRPGKGG